jgi:hypothetical protein
MDGVLVEIYHKFETLPSEYITGNKDPKFIATLMAIINQGDAALARVAWMGVALFVMNGYETYIREWIKTVPTKNIPSSFFTSLFEESHETAIRFYEDYKRSQTANCCEWE